MKSNPTKKILGLTPLTLRFMLTATLLVFIPLAIHTYLHLGDLIRLKKHIFKYRAETLATNIDQEIQRKKIIHDPAALQSFIEKIKFQNQDISRINIYGLQEGKYVVIASSVYPLRGTDADKDDILPIQTKKINIIEKMVDNLPYLEVQAPIYEKEQPIASVGFYLDLKALEKEQQTKILINTLLVIFFFLIIMLIMYFYFHRLLVKPILSLRQAVQKVADGNLRTKAPVYHQDELGEITAAFNRMTEELKAAQEKLLDMARLQASAQMAGTAAHELNQPLSVISINGDMLLRNFPQNDPRREQVITMLEQVERMAKIVKMMSQITDYQTQQYLGETDIIDLEKASKKKEP